MKDKKEENENQGKGGQGTRILIYFIIIVIVAAAVSVMLMFLFSNDRGGARPDVGPQPPEEELMIIKKKGAPPEADDGVARTAGSLAVLVETEPPTLSALEAVMGKVDRDMKEEMHMLRRIGFSELISRLDMTFSIDMHHGNPFETRDPWLKGYSMILVEGREFCMQRLEKQYGKPDTIKAGVGELFKYRTDRRTLWKGFYVLPGEGDAFRLDWNASGVKAPDFAVPERTAEETEKLQEKIIAVLEAGLTREALEERFGKLALKEGRIYDFFAFGDTWMLEFDPKEMFMLQMYFEPPLPGKRLVEALGVSTPVIVSTDVHMTSRVVGDLKTSSMPVFQGFQLYMHVEEDGLEKTDLKWPASAVWRASNINITGIFIKGTDPF